MILPKEESNLTYGAGSKTTFIVTLEGDGISPGSFGLNYREFLDSCLFVEFSLFLSQKDMRGESSLQK